jgi:hypothetical protein
VPRAARTGRLKFSVQFVEKLNIMVFTTMPKPAIRSGIGDNRHHGVVANGRSRFSLLCNNGWKATGFAYERI